MEKQAHLYMKKYGHNKFYSMYNNEDGTFTAYWGKIGTRGQCKDYPIGKWHDKWLEKLIEKNYDSTDHTQGLVTYEEHLAERRR